MTMTAEEILVGAGNRVDHYAERWTTLVRSIDDWFSANVPEALPALNDGRDRFQMAVVEIHQAIKHPRLVLATTGTTSGGKSTVVNFLCGAGLLPVAVQEMSAGVVTIDHHPSRRILRILPTVNAKWPTGEWTLELESAQDRMREIMDAYREARDLNESVDPPRIEIEFPTWIGQHAQDLGLPEGFSLRLLDLPGLKFVGDEQNASVIRAQCQQALCIVTYNSNETDPEKKRALLGEVVSQVRDLRGSPARMLFLLNRIDVFRQDKGWPDTEQKFIEQTRQTIRQQIQVALPEYGEAAAAVEVIPFSSQPAFCALQASLSPSDGLASLMAINKFYGVLIPDEISDELPRRPEKWSDADRRRVIALVLEHSYANAFLEHLRGHIQQNLPQLILPQVLKKVVDAAQGTLTIADQSLNAMLHSTEAQFEAELQRLTQIGKRLAAVRREANDRLNPLRTMPDRDGAIVEYLTDTARLLEQSYGLPKEALYPIHDWNTQIGLELNDLLDSVYAALSNGTRRPEGSAINGLSNDHRAAIEATCNQLIDAGYTGALALKGGRVEGYTPDVKAKLRAINGGLNQLAVALAAALPVALQRVGNREAERVKEALDGFFHLHASQLAERSATVARDLAGLAVPGFSVARVAEPMSWRFSFWGGFPVTNETRSEKVGDQDYWTGKRRLWYWAWLKTEDVYESRPVYEERAFEIAVIPRLEEVFGAFAEQARNTRPQREFASWLNRQIDAFMHRLEEYQTRTLDVYRIRLEEARALASSVRDEQRAQLTPLRDGVTALLGEAVALMDIGMG